MYPISLLIAKAREVYLNEDGCCQIHFPKKFTRKLSSLSLSKHTVIRVSILVRRLSRHNLKIFEKDLFDGPLAMVRSCRVRTVILHRDKVSPRGVAAIRGLSQKLGCI
jgi:hypothetical protein